MAASNVVGGKGQITAGAAAVTFLVDAGSSITIDRKNASRRTCNVVLSSGFIVGSNARVIPQSGADLFAPFGNELTLFYTSVTNGVQTDTQMGVFLLTNISIDDNSPDLKMTVQGSDRAKTYARAGFTDTYTIAGRTAVTTAIKDLLSSRPVAFAQTFNVLTSAAVMPAAPTVYGPGDDPWAKAAELAASIGYALFMDAYGVTTLVPVPAPAQAVLATYAEGNDNTAVKINRKLSNAATPNYVIRDGQGSGVAVPVRGIAKDTNPASPTYTGGPYGTVTDYKSSSLYATAAQALAAAQADLALSLGSAEVVQIDIIPAPARDVDDVLSVTRVRAGIVAGTRYVVDAVSCSFDAGSLMALTARTVAATP